MLTDEKNRPPPDWPAEGNLEFNNVYLRYRESLPFALNGLSFDIPAGQKVGVVGRTGAGMFSLHFYADLFKIIFDIRSLQLPFIHPEQERARLPLLCFGSSRLKEA